MAIYRRTASPDGAADRPEFLLLGGYCSLGVVGESYYQDNLWSLVGGRNDPARRVRKEIIAVLTPEPNNLADSEAIAVFIEGLKVGHLSFADARLYGPGVRALQDSYGQRVALGGVITGGGVREDGLGMLGVFLNVNPDDFDLESSGSDEDEPTESIGYSDELERMTSLPMTDVSAIAELRRFLVQEPNPIRRHYVYADIEARLYRCRDMFASALDDYDQTCSEHDAEMDDICNAFMAEMGAVPALALYRQMAIRQQKIHDYRTALRWAERGIALYSGRAANAEGLKDLRHRAAMYRAKLAARLRQ